MDRIKAVGIYGSSSGRNAGDAALISGIMEGIDQATGRRLVYEIPTYRPDYIWYEYSNKTRPASMLPWHGSVGMFGPATFSSFKRCDLNVIYDNMLFDKKLYNPLFNYMPAVWLYYTKMKRKGQLLGMYNVGCGPITTEAGRKELREIANSCDFITVRDEDSLNLLREVGVDHNRILVTADAALTVLPSSKERSRAILREQNIPENTELLAVNINSYLGTWSGSSRSSLSAAEFLRIYSEAIKSVVNDLKVPLVFVATQHSDVKITNELRGLLGGIPSFLVSNVTNNHHDMKGVLGEMSFLFAMRLHANILATSMTTPSVSLSFQKKVTSYYKELGLPECVMSFDSFSVENVRQHILTGWNRRHEIRRHLELQIPYLQQKSLVAAHVVKTLDKGATGEEAIQAGETELSKLVRPSINHQRQVA